MLLLLLLLLLLLTAPGQSGSQPAAAMCDPRTGLSRPVARCGPPAPPPQCRGGGELRHAFDGTVLRQYCLHAPPSPPPPTAAGSPPKQAPLPLLVYLHDEGEGVDQIYRHTSLPRQAETFALSPGLRGFVLALPQAGALRPPAAAPAGACATGWDYWHRNFSTGRACADCPMGNLSTNADIAFVDRVVDAAVSSGRVDPTKVFVGGWGAGGFFAQMYGAARARDAGSAQPSRSESWRRSSSRFWIISFFAFGSCVASSRIASCLCEWMNSSFRLEQLCLISITISSANRSWGTSISVRYGARYARFWWASSDLSSHSISS
jgi:hypothetical protein